MSLPCTRLALIAAFISCAIPGAASACRVWLPPEDRIAKDYEVDRYERILLVRVTHAAYSGEASDKPRGWSGIATIERTLAGSANRGEIAFSGGLGSGSCDLGLAIPAVGERWVLYYRKGAGTAFLAHALPVDMATKADPRLKLGAR